MRLLLAVAWLFTALAVSPAEAAKKQPLRTPSPCDHVIPTGQPLPRQSTADKTGASGILVYGTDRPAWNEKPVAIIGKDEPFTVLRECNMLLQVRDVRGVVGWVNVVVSDAEKRFWLETQKRTAKTDADCELLYLDPVVIGRCKAKLAANRQHADEVEHGDYLAGAELRDFLADKTLVFLPREGPLPGLKEEIYVYYAPDGEIFFYREEMTVNWRGRYTVEDSRLCAPESGTRCGRFRKSGDEVVFAEDQGREYRVHATAGDSHRIVAEVSKRYPEPRKPPAPSGSESVAGPAMGQ